MSYLYTCPECGHTELADVQEPRTCPDCLCDMYFEVEDEEFDGDEYEGD